MSKPLIIEKTIMLNLNRDEAIVLGNTLSLLLAAFVRDPHPAITKEMVETIEKIYNDLSLHVVEEGWDSEEPAPKERIIN